MRTNRTLRTVATVLASSLVISACGQKAGVRVDGDGLAAGVPGAGGDGSGIVTDGTGGVVEDGTTGFDDGTGAAVTDGSGVATDGTSGGQTTTTTTGGTAQQQGTGGDTGSGGQQQPGQPGGQNPGDQGGGGGGGSAALRGNDFTGAPQDKVVIGLHAPATGAAPLPTTSFEKARGTYWNYVINTKKEKVLGRSKVDVLFKDDKYDPNSAGQVCKELASVSFLVAGGGGTDQIQRCGQLANVGKFPYFSAGVTEDGLRGNPWYYASSMSYAQQGAILAQMIKKDPFGTQAPGVDATMGKVMGPGAKIGMIITNTPNFKDAKNGFLNGLKANGLALATLKNGQPALVEHTKNDATWIENTAGSFKDAGVEVVYFLSAPTLYLEFVSQANKKKAYNPLYVGPGVSKGLNAVLNGGCKAVGKGDDNALYLSPFPGLDKAPKAFKDASAAAKAPADDIALALWGLAEGQHQLFKRYEQQYGTELERATFRDFVEKAGTIETSVYPPVTFTKDNHFGAGKAWVLEADCSTKQYFTKGNAPVAGF